MTVPFLIPLALGAVLAMGVTVYMFTHQNHNQHYHNYQNNYYDPYENEEYRRRRSRPRPSSHRTRNSNYNQHDEPAWRNREVHTERLGEPRTSSMNSSIPRNMSRNTHSERNDRREKCYYCHVPISSYEEDCRRLPSGEWAHVDCIDAFGDIMQEMK